MTANKDNQIQAIHQGPSIKVLEEKLGYQFEDPRLLEEALTHPTYAHEHPDPELKDNQRLEFLGDAVLNLVVGHQLMRYHPEAREGELTRMRKEAIVESVKSDIKLIIKNIDKEFKDEKYWQLFDKYFDQVHQDFIHRIKEKHPVLTPNDLRLCAYLRMNLSTKEIAPLMNISIRGLEISRYRLRKKLGLDRDTNLTKYIMEI